MHTLLRRVSALEERHADPQTAMLLQRVSALEERLETMQEERRLEANLNRDRTSVRIVDGNAFILKSCSAIVNPEGAFLEYPKNVTLRVTSTYRVHCPPSPKEMAELYPTWKPVADVLASSDPASLWEVKVHQLGPAERKVVDPDGPESVMEQLYAAYVFAKFPEIARVERVPRQPREGFGSNLPPDSTVHLKLSERTKTPADAMRLVTEIFPPKDKKLYFTISTATRGN